MTAFAPIAAMARLRARLRTVLLVLLTVAVISFSFFTLIALDQAIAPELSNRTRLIGALIRNEVQRAIELGVPIASIGGLEAYLEGLLADFPDVKRIGIIDSAGTPLAQALREEPSGLIGGQNSLAERIGVGPTEFTTPILAGTTVVGQIEVQGSARFVETRFRDALLDVAVLALVALMVGLELTTAALSTGVVAPFRRIVTALRDQARGSFGGLVDEKGIASLRQLAIRINDRAQHLADAARAAGHGALPVILRLSFVADIRLALFLLVIGTETTASFLPVLAGSAARPEGLPAAMAAALPLVSYLFCISLVSPWAGRLSRKFGPRRLFVAASLPAMAALVLMASSDLLWLIVLARAAIGICYAMATVACQDYALRAEAEDEADSASGTYFAVVFAGTLCGSVIGGVIAGRFGYQAAIISGAAFVAAAAALGARYLSGRAGDPEPMHAPDGVDAPRSLAGLLLVVLGLAVPLSATTAMVVWYFAPLVLSGAGLRPGDVARVVMCYPLATIILTPLVSSTARSSMAMLFFAALGGLVSASALLTLAIWQSSWSLAGVLILLGAGHAMMRAPTYQLAVGVAGQRRGGLSLLRSGERAGAMMALLLVAWIDPADRFAFMAGVGGLVGALTVAFFWGWLMLGKMGGNREVTG